MIRLLKDRRLWLALAALGLLLAARVSGIEDYLSLDMLRAHRIELKRFIAVHWGAAALAYTAIYTLTVALSMPGALVLTLAGGFLFGALAGSLLSVIGATAGATIAFLFARTIFGDDAPARFGDTAQQLAANIKQNAWPYLLVLRLVPLFPFILVNLIPALAGVGTSTYVLTTFLGILPATVAFSFAGAGLGDVLNAGGDVSVRSILTPNIVLGLLGLAALSLAAIPLRRRFAGQAKPSSSE